MMSGHKEIELVKLYVSCLSAATHAIGLKLNLNDLFIALFPIIICPRYLARLFHIYMLPNLKSGALFNSMQLLLQHDPRLRK